MTPAAVNEREASIYLGVSVHTLRKWRRARRGPRFVKLPGAERRGHGPAGRVLYRELDLAAFLEEATVPTWNPMPERPAAPRALVGGRG